MMRKLFLLASLALGALAVMAASAFATNPDFPHGDYDAGDWRAVNVYATVGATPCIPEAVDCQFDTGTDNVWAWEIEHPILPTEHAGCVGGIAGSFDGDGSISVSDAEMTEPWYQNG